MQPPASHFFFKYTLAQRKYRNYNQTGQDSESTLEKTLNQTKINTLNHQTLLNSCSLHSNIWQQDSSHTTRRSYCIITKNRNVDFNDDIQTLSVLNCGIDQIR